MIITRETDYAIRILRSLADLQLKNIREISDEQLVPRQFAYKISKKLERAGFIEIIRGAQGGCRLTRDLHGITLMDIINVMERENMITAAWTAISSARTITAMVSVTSTKPWPGYRASWPIICRHCIYMTSCFPMGDRPF